MTGFGAFGPTTPACGLEAVSQAGRVRQACSWRDPGTVFLIVRRGPGGFLLRGRAAGMDHESDQVPEEHLVDALALRGDEGRGTLR